MTSVISESVRKLRPLFKFVKSSNGEKKISKCNEAEKTVVIEAISFADLKIVNVTVDKSKITRKKLFGSELYKRLLTELIDHSLEELDHNDVHIIIDSSYYIRQEDFKALCNDLSHKHGKHLMKCYKGISQNDPCIRIADFVAGAIWYHYERKDDTLYRKIEKRLIDARR